MSGWQPKVSIVMPTHNRVGILAMTLGALCRQTYPPERLELVVVADGCVDETAVFVQQYQAPFPIRLREQPGSGPATARNVGAQVATGDILIFIDDDIEALPHFVAAHVAAHRADAPGVVIGHLPLVENGRAGYFDQGINAWWRQRFFEMSQPGYRFGYGDLFSGNFSVAAALFRQVQGFNTALWCHEDYELGMRLAAAGGRFAFAPEATGIHHDVTDWQRSLRRRVAEGKADVYLAQQQPQLLSQLPLRAGDYSVLSKGLRFLAFRQPKLGRGATAVLSAGLPILEALRFKRAWTVLFAHLQDYWYWQGVAEVADPADIQQIFADAAALADVAALDVVDVTAVLPPNPTRAAPAEGVSLQVGAYPVAHFTAVLGAEKLRLAHLQGQGATDTIVRGFFEETQHVTELTEEDAEFLQSAAYWFDTPKSVGAIDLTETAVASIDQPSGGQHLLAKFGKLPLGWVNILPQQGAAALSQRITKELGWPLATAAWAQSLVPERVVERPSITVIVCTRNRTAQLADCLAALLRLDYPDYQILIIDNAPSDNGTAQLVKQVARETAVGVRYVREDRPGLDWARNRAIHEATTDLIAFTDDDACPDTNWLQAIADAFAEPEVMAVTGPAVPSELETRYQNLFEFGYGGMSHTLERRIMRRAEYSDVDLLWASGFGVGANMAFRRALFADVGLFDEALDVGTPSGGGGDVEMFHRVVAQGHTLLYEPRAFVWHSHRRSEQDLQKLMANNGRSFGVYLLTCWRNRTVRRSAIVYFALRYWAWGWLLKRLLWPGDFPRRYIVRELWATLSSPLAYVKTQRHTARIRQETGVWHQADVNWSPQRVE